jgi:hypothetical protein
MIATCKLIAFHGGEEIGGSGDDLRRGSSVHGVAFANLYYAATLSKAAAGKRNRHGGDGSDEIDLLDLAPEIELVASSLLPLEDRFSCPLP